VGAVQKLATVVIVGLVALATLLVIYLADEPNRMAAEVVEKDDVAIERGINTFVQNCVICHGPAGEGYSEPGAEGTGRIGMPLGGDTEQGRAATELNQSEDPVTRQQRHDLIVKTINNGRGLMPAFGTGAEGGALLNQEQISELALMIQNVDWDLVYNEAIAASGGYPTFPPPPAPAGGAQPTQAPTTGGGEDAGDVATSDQFTIESHDIFFQPTEIDVPSDTEITILLPNLGASPHNFSIDALDVSVDIAPGETKEVTITAPEGQYEFYCNIPGHKEAGMVGTLISRPMTSADTAATADENAAADADEAAQEAAGEAPLPATEQVVTAFDIYFEPKEVTIPANTDVTFMLPNDGAAPHNFSIDELGVSVDLAPGATEQVVINAPPGTYEYYCNIPGHKEAGMVGTLIVAEGGGEQAAAPAAGGATAESAPAQDEAAPAAAEQSAAEPIEIVSHDIFFEPKEVTIPADTDVTVSLPNQGAAPHNFSIDELGISVDIAPGATEQVVINAPAGTYEFHCNIPGHKEAGMVGTLTVSGDGGEGAAATSAQPAAAGATGAAPAESAGAQEAAPAAGAAAAGPVEVVSHDIYFEPKEVSIPANTDVTFTLPNQGAAPHNFSIDELGISVDIAPGATEEVVVNAPPGTYEIHCNIPGHKEAGMVGTLTVA
jgi:uncharacterized cupredoxin-like copper-binding protein/mono/diheme cytochrome c family protein